MRPWRPSELPPTDPRPKPGTSPSGPPVEWLEPANVEIARGSPATNDTLTSIMRSRRSQRTMSAASVQAVAEVVRFVLRTDFIGTGRSHGRKLKAVVSAGALHPVKCIIVDQTGASIAYDDAIDTFFSVGIRDADSMISFLDNCRNVLPTARGHWLAFLADNSDLSALYSDFPSLLWRDAGAVVQMMALAAEAHELAFCPLGILGSEAAAAMLPDTGRYVAVGVAAIGLSDS